MRSLASNHPFVGTEFSVSNASFEVDLEGSQLLTKGMKALPIKDIFIYPNGNCNHRSMRDYYM